TALAVGDTATAAARLGEVQAMLAVLGLDATQPAWQQRRDDHGRLTAVVDGLVRALLDQRAAARSRRDYATADSLRDSLQALGVTVTDTPQGPRWALREN
ncbi:MAG: cysteine--tRNA ligase, partial [Microlunatus sp.]|nr:cysteine--tRNA ligase [Microlunatus sp.]